jgi:hypothetical protein
MVDDCTIGAKIIGKKLFMFKNRDLRYENFKDQATFDDHLFAVTGVNIGTDELVGVSIGVNRWGLAACSANVLITNDAPYDILLDRILRNSKNIQDVTSIVSNSFQFGESYQWCNIITATHEGIAAFEIGPKKFDKEEHVDKLVRTNHHILLPTKKDLLAAKPEERECGGTYALSEKRRRKTTQLIDEVSNLKDVISLLSTHSETKGYDSICRHRLATIDSDKYLGETTYGYIIEMYKNEGRDLEFSIHVAQSNPCMNPFQKIKIDFDSSREEKKIVVSSFP